MRLIGFALGSLLLVLISSAQARGGPITIYTDASAFTAAVGSTTLIDFEALNPNGDSSYEFQNSPLIVGDVSFAQTENRLFVIGSDYSGYNTHGLTSDYLNGNGSAAVSGIDVSFANGVFGVGMELGYIWLSQPSNAVTFTLSTGDVLETTVPLVGNTNNSLAFFGFTSDVAIVSFNVNGPSRGVVIDNLQYAQSLASVPDAASTLSLLSVSLAGVIAARRRFSA